MSSTTSTKRNRKFAVIGATALVALGIAGFGLQTSGADFSASQAGTATFSTAKLDLTVSDGQNAKGYDLQFNNLKPGETIADEITVTNTGTIAGKASLVGTGQVKIQGGQLTEADYSELLVNGVPVSQLTGPIELGNLAAGEAKTFRIELKLAQEAGNEWQNVQGTSPVVVELKQL